MTQAESIEGAVILFSSEENKIVPLSGPVPDSLRLTTANPLDILSEEEDNGIKGYVVTVILPLLIFLLRPEEIEKRRIKEIEKKLEELEPDEDQVMTAPLPEWMANEATDPLELLCAS